MTLKKFLPVALMVAGCAAIYVIVAQYFKVSALWLPFIGWPLYFLAGAKPSRLHKEIIGITGGIFFGYITLLVLPVVSGLGTLALPIIVFFIAFIIVLLELTDWFEMAPAYFFAYASYFAYQFGGFGGPSSTIASNMFPVWGLIMVGLGLGYISALLKVKILESEGLYGEDQNVIKG